MGKLVYYIVRQEREVKIVAEDMKQAAAAAADAFEGGTSENNENICSSVEITDLTIRKEL